MIRSRKQVRESSGRVSKIELLAAAWVPKFGKNVQIIEIQSKNVRKIVRRVVLRSKDESKKLVTKISKTWNARIFG